MTEVVHKYWKSQLGYQVAPHGEEHEACFKCENWEGERVPYPVKVTPEMCKKVFGSSCAGAWCMLYRGWQDPDLMKEKW